MTMIHLGYRQLTFRCIMIYSIWLFFNLTSNIQANQTECVVPYNLQIQDEESTYLQFNQLAMSDSVKVILFQMKIDNQNFVANDSTYFFAWIKNSFGKAVFTLPSSFMAMSLGLYRIFIQGLKITLIDSTQGCYSNFNDTDKRQIVFETLIHFTQLKSNRTCNDKYCPKLCLRHFTLNDGAFGKRMQYCCLNDILHPQVNITGCLTTNKNPLPYVPWSITVVDIVSVCLAGMIFNNIANWFLGSLQRYRKMKSTPVVILNNIKQSEVGHFYLTGDDCDNPTTHLIHAIKYSLFVMIASAIGGQCLSIQRFPVIYIIYPKMNPSFYPIVLKKTWSFIGVLNGFCIPMIVLADIKLYYRAKYYKDQQLQHCDISQRRRCISQNSFRQSYFLVKCYLYDIIDDLKSFHVIKFILDLAALVMILTFFLSGSVGILRCWFFLMDGLTLRFRTAFLSCKSMCSIFKIILSIIFTGVAFFYSFIAIVTSTIFIQIIVRVILTTSAFIVTFASHFNFIIIMAIPFMHYILQTIDVYIRNDQVIPERIIQLQQRLDQDIDQILQADQGILVVHVAIRYDNIIDIDLPEMLQEDHIRLSIQRYIQCLQFKANHQMTDGISTFTVRYYRSSDNTVNVTLSQCIIGCHHCPFHQEVQPVLNYIQQHLQDKDIDYFKHRLTSVYYLLENGTSDSSIAIPDQLYQYLRYHSPQISLTIGRILFNVILIVGFFLIFILTAMLDYRAETFASLNSAIANTPVVYVATVLSLRNLKLAQVKDEEIDKILLASIIQYRRGYRLFCTIGISFQPIVQLIRMTFSDIGYPQHNRPIQPQPDEYNETDTLLGNNNFFIN